MMNIEKWVAVAAKGGYGEVLAAAWWGPGKGVGTIITRVNDVPRGEPVWAVWTPTHVGSADQDVHSGEITGVTWLERFPECLTTLRELAGIVAAAGEAHAAVTPRTEAEIARWNIHTA